MWLCASERWSGRPEKRDRRPAACNEHCCLSPRARAPAHAYAKFFLVSCGEGTEERRVSGAAVVCGALA
jgi:hypothetical protein